MLFFLWPPFSLSIFDDAPFRIHNAARLMARDAVSKDGQDRETEMRKAGGAVELFLSNFCLYFFTKVERWLEKEINVSSCRPPLPPLLPTTLSAQSPALPGGSAAAAAVATMAAVLSPTNTLRSQRFLQDDSPCANHYQPLCSVLRSHFSAL
jgi:hypothetical protein